MIIPIVFMKSDQIFIAWAFIFYDGHFDLQIGFSDAPKGYTHRLVWLLVIVELYNF